MSYKLKGSVFGIENEIEFADIKGSLDLNSKPLVTVLSSDYWERYVDMLNRMPLEDVCEIVSMSQPDYL